MSSMHIVDIFTSAHDFLPQQDLLYNCSKVDLLEQTHLWAW